MVTSAAAILRLQSRDVSAADVDRASRNLLQPCEQVEQRRLPATGGPEQHQELSIVHTEIEVLEHTMIAALVRDI
jgi:hypothetical protein